MNRLSGCLHSSMMALLCSFILFSTVEFVRKQRQRSLASQTPTIGLRQSNSHSSFSTGIIDTREEKNIENEPHDDFDIFLWPNLRKKLCPEGSPDLSMGSKLFELGRMELGVEPHPDAKAFDEKNVSEVFYNGGFGYTIFIDGHDPNNTVFYAPVWKCANDQIHTYLHLVFNRKGNGKVRNETSPVGNRNDFYMEKLKNSDMAYLFHKQWYTTDKDYKTGESSYFKFNETERDKPCMFTVLRDPIGHFMSGYNEIEYRFLTNAHDAPPKDRYDDLPSYTKIGVDATKEGIPAREHLQRRFEEFVRNILEEHPSFVEFTYSNHVASMSRILPTLSRLHLIPKATAGLPTPLWYVPKLENLTEDFPRFLEQRCPKVAANYNDGAAALPAMPVKGRHESSKDNFGTYQAARDVWSKGGRVSRSLCHIHAMDYACYNDGFEIPALCREVYSSTDFRESILGEQ